VAHPTRVHLLAILDVRTASPKELAEELGERINNVGYHIKVLRDLDCIELVEERPTQGSRVTEHFYKANRVPLLDQDIWDQLDANGKWAVVTSIMRVSSQDLNESFAAGVFMDPDDNHLSRTPLIVDGEGWEEVTTILDEALERLFDVRENVSKRTQKDAGIATMPIKVQMFQFRSPSRKKDA